MNKRVFPIGLFLIALSLFFITQAASVHAEPGAKNSIHQAVWEGDNISGELYVNGFIITTFTGAQSVGTSPLNHFLIGENKIWAKVRKADLSKPAHLSFSISKLGQGAVAATNERGNQLSVELRDDYFKGAGVLTMSRKFESALNFSKNLSGTRKVSEKEVIEYAKQIYGLFKAKNATGILKEFTVKLNDYSKAYSSNAIAAEFESSLTKELLPGKLSKINPEKLKAKKTGPSNTLWQVFDGDKEMIRITSADGSITEMSMYIGVVDGKLQVIR